MTPFRGVSMRWRQTSSGGFSLVELIMVAGLFAIIAAIAIPSMSVGERVRVNNAASQVRQAMQTARLRAVAVNRPLQLRFNCPGTGQIRVVEAGWPESGRCDGSRYPFPTPSDAAYQIPAQPRYDGPVQYLNSQISIAAADPTLVLQFGPDGRVSKVVGGLTQDIVSVPVTVSANGYTKTISVNNLGKVVTQ
jgi:Tfp pilus assembly protein FimT